MAVTASVNVSLLRELLAREGCAWVTLCGDSMAPTLERGARLRVLPCDRPLPGDVVLIDGGRFLITHRVVRRGPSLAGWLIAHAGDAAPPKIRIVLEDRIVGRIDSARVLPKHAARLKARLHLTRAACQAWAARTLARRAYTPVDPID